MGSYGCLLIYEDVREFDILNSPYQLSLSLKQGVIYIIVVVFLKYSIVLVRFQFNYQKGNVYMVLIIFYPKIILEDLLKSRCKSCMVVLDRYVESLYLSTKKCVNLQSIAIFLLYLLKVFNCQLLNAKEKGILVSFYVGVMCSFIVFVFV